MFVKLSLRLDQLNTVLHSIISRIQGVLIGGRQILVGAVIVNEYIDSILKDGFVCDLSKLDLEKAYDCVTGIFWIIC